MSKREFSDPKMAINRVYTGTGDRGNTKLVGGQKVPKDNARVEAYGTVDELNAHIGALRQSLAESALSAPAAAAFAAILLRLQHELFNLGAVLATLPEDVHPSQAQIREGDVTRLEREIDEYNEDLPALRSFVLPGGSRLNTELHLCRTVCRRAERRLVSLSAESPVPEQAIRYLNRLSDAFFVWSRWVQQQLGEPEVLWDPNQAASAN